MFGWNRSVSSNCTDNEPFVLGFSFSVLLNEECDVIQGTMLRLWLLGARRLGCRERVLIALVIFAALMVLSLRNSVTPVPSDTHLPLASFRLPASRSSSRDGGAIPRILHQTWQNDQVPEVVKPWVISWLQRHPGWEYWFWTDEDMHHFIQTKYSQFIKLYDSYPKQGYRNDVFRFVMYR